MHILPCYSEVSGGGGSTPSTLTLLHCTKSPSHCSSSQNKMGRHGAKGKDNETSLTLKHLSVKLAVNLWSRGNLITLNYNFEWMLCKTEWKLLYWKSFKCVFLKSSDALILEIVRNDVSALSLLKVISIPTHAIRGSTNTSKYPCTNQVILRKV